MKHPRNGGRWLRGAVGWGLVVWLAGPVAAANLLPNPGFEEGRPGNAPPWSLNFWQPAGQPRSAGGVVGDVAHSGRRSLRMTGTGPSSHAYWSCRNLLSEPGRRYVLSAWVRPHGVVSPGSYGRIHIGFQDDQGTIIEDQDHPFYAGWAWATVTGYSDWVPLGVATVAPPRTARMAVTLRFVGVGEAWFDDVELTSDDRPVPIPPPDLSREATIDPPGSIGGEATIALRLHNPWPEPVTDLAITAAGPAGTTGETAGPHALDGGARAEIPVRLHLPSAFTSRDARVLLTGRYRLGGQPRESSWLVSLDVVAADLLAAIAEGRWGLTESTIAAGAPALEVLGAVLERDGAPRYYSAYEPLTLDPDDEVMRMVVRVNGVGLATGSASLAWECLDYFFRSAAGRLDLTVPAGRSYLVAIPIPARQVARIRQTGREAGAAKYRFIARLLRDGVEVAARQIDPPLAPDLPHYAKLDPLPGERRDDLPAFGRLRLVDEVDCGDPTDPHPLRQGGKGLSTKYTGEPLDYYGGSDRLNYDWWRTYRDERERFTRIETVSGRACRVAEDWGWFAYRMGRGALEPGKYYVLVVEYPADASRNYLLWNTIDARATIGFHTGSALGDPYTRQRLMEKVDLPLSGGFEQHFSLLHARQTEGWVAVHAMGAKAAPFSKGIAVSALRLYELGDAAALERLALPATEPVALPRRLLGFFSEDATPSAANLPKYRFYGLNAYAPLTLSYGGGTYETNSGYVGWPSKLFGPERLTNPMALAKPPFYRRRDVGLEAICAGAEEAEMAVLPVLEYGGTGRLDPDALAVWPDGSPHHYHWGTITGPDGRRTTRYLSDGVGLDMAHPAVGADLEALVDELATLYAPRYRSFGGVILTQRFQAWQVGYGRSQLERFAAERGLTLPAGDPGGWVALHHEAEYRAWHYQQKRLNLLRAAAALRRVRPDLKLYVLNHNGGDDNLHFGTPLYWWDKERGDEFLVPGGVSLPNLSKLDLAALMEDWRRPDIAPLSVGMSPPLYREDRGIVNLAPARYPFLCGNAAFLEHFRTGEGIAVCNWWIYNEDAYLNHPAIGWNCPGLNGNEPAGRASMLDEVLAMAAADPFVMGVRIGHLNRGYPAVAREFAAAYRALPAVPSRIVPACPDREVVVRRYDTARGTYLAVINTGLGPADKEVVLRLPELGGKRLRNLVTGEEMRGEEWHPRLPPVSLTAWRVEP